MIDGWEMVNSPRVVRSRDLVSGLYNKLGITFHYHVPLRTIPETQFGKYFFVSTIKLHAFSLLYDCRSEFQFASLDSNILCSGK